jgi:hypothetical protein
MTGHKVLAVVTGVLGVTAWPVSAPASANPATPTAVIEAAAAQLCAAIGLDQTESGVRTGMRALYKQGLDDVDGALVLLTAVHHVCPAHERLVLASVAPDPVGRALTRHW